MKCERCDEGFPCPDCDGPMPIRPGDEIEIRLSWPMFDTRDLRGTLVWWEGVFLDVRVEGLGLVRLRWDEHTIRWILKRETTDG